MKVCWHGNWKHISALWWTKGCLCCVGLVRASRKVLSSSIELLRKLPTYDYFIKFSLDLFCTLQSALSQWDLIYLTARIAYAESSVPHLNVICVILKLRLLFLNCKLVVWQQPMNKKYICIYLTKDVILLKKVYPKFTIVIKLHCYHPSMFYHSVYPLFYNFTITHPLLVLSFWLSISLSICPCIHPSIHLSICQ